MHHPTIDDHVRLKHAVPDLWLQSGDVGVIRSVWHFSTEFYEVEFQTPFESFAVRALIGAEGLEVIETEGATSS